MKKRIFVFLVLLAAARASKADALDMHGGDLLPSDYEVLSGTYTNVGEFRIGLNITAFTGQEAGLFVYASTITITGRLNADGSGYRGGNAGPVGFAGGPGSGPGKGGGGLVVLSTGAGGGGGGYGDADGNGTAGGPGRGSGGGAGGLPYNSTSYLTVPFSADDLSLGSGGGGGGGVSTDTTSGAGGAGGGAIYLEAGYITITGSVTVSGLDGNASIDTWDCNSTPGGGGGGAGGAISIRAAGRLTLSGAWLAADGGNGGAAICAGGTPANSGGGGAGGRIRLAYRELAASSVAISTKAGKGGAADFFGTSYAQSGSSGTVSYALTPSSPTGFVFSQVFVTSISYSWTVKPLAEWGQAIQFLPPLTTRQFRLYESTTAAPLSDFYRNIAVSSDATGVIEQDLTPDTAVSRFLTAYSDFGDSLPSAVAISTTDAAAPYSTASSAFPAAAEDSLTFAWSSGTAAEGFNPAYTAYEISRATASDFSAPVSTGFVIGLSSAPAGLLANTTYYFRARALGLNNAYTAFTQQMSSVTLALAPSGPVFSEVHIASLSFAWSAGANPAGTLFEAQISANCNFLTLSSAALTQATTAQFTDLSPGTLYCAQVRAVNYSNIRSSFTAVISTTPGNFTNTAEPARSEPPQPTAKFSYDGSATFTWYPPSGSVELFSYFLEIGSTPGGNDFLFGFEIPSSILSYSTNTLVSGKTYYARVKAKSSAGKLGDWSEPGPGVTVWISQAEAPVVKPYNWPNPFDPAQGATNIGFNLSAPAEVTLKIFTLQGRLVREEKRSEPSAGNKVWEWNGRNDEGRMVEPGGYVCLLIKRYAGRAETQKFKLAVLY